MKIQFVSDDGKKVGTEEEVKKYESALSTANADWEKIQKATDQLNKLVAEYAGNHDGGISVSIRNNKIVCEKHSSEVDAIMKMFSL